MATLPVSSALPSTYFESSCAGKERHATEPAARAAIKFYEDRGHLRSGNCLDVYRCGFCDSWHVGHQRRP